MRRLSVDQSPTHPYRAFPPSRSTASWYCALYAPLCTVATYLLAEFVGGEIDCVPQTFSQKQRCQATITSLHAECSRCRRYVQKNNCCASQVRQPSTQSNHVFVVANSQIHAPLQCDTKMGFMRHRTRRSAPTSRHNHHFLPPRFALQCTQSISRAERNLKRVVNRRPLFFFLRLLAASSKLHDETMTRNQPTFETLRQHNRAHGTHTLKSP